MSGPSTSTDVCLPYVSLQPDFAQVYTDVAQGIRRVERAWLSVYCLNAPRASIHAKLLLTNGAASDGVDIDLEAAFTTQLNMQKADEARLDLSIASTSQNGSTSARTTTSSISLPRTFLRVPKRTLGPLVKGPLGITAFDVSPTGNNLYVAAGADGQAHVGTTGESSASIVQQNGAGEDDDIEARAQERMRRRLQERQAAAKTYLKGHFGDVRSARFFPSGEVLLTTSSDCTARVFGIDGSNPRTLTGHRRAVLGSAFIDRGKQVLTASADGTTRLWDVSKGIQVTSFPSQNYSSVNTVTLGSGSGEAAGSASSKLLVTGLSNGTLEAHDTDSRSVVFRLPRSRFPSGPAPQASDSWEQVWSGGVDALDWSRGGNVLLAGCSNGVTMLHDVRMLSSSTSSDLSADDTSRSVLYSWRRNGAAINDAQLLNAGKEAIMATADGTPYRVDLSSDVPRVVEEYTGWDVDNVQRACWVEGRSRVWLAGADGMARMY